MRPIIRRDTPPRRGRWTCPRGYRLFSDDDSFVQGDEDGIAVIDTATNEVIATIPAGVAPWGVETAR